MSLTLKQTGFCQDYVKTHSATESYRLNYETSAMKPTSVVTCAHALMQNRKILAYIDRLRGVVEQKVTILMAKEEVYDRKAAAKEVDEAVAIAKKKNNAGAMIAGIQLKAKLYGLIIDKAEIKTTVIDELNDKDALAVMDALRTIASSRDQRVIDDKTIIDVTPE